MRISVGMGTCGIASGADVIYNAIKDEIKDKNITLVKTGCIGMCNYEPIVEIYNDGKRTTYVNVKKEDIPKILSGKTINELLINENTINITEDNFYKKQTRIVLNNCGIIDPENINEYKFRNGYKALEKVLNSMEKIDVIEILKNSKLRGRGGAGFPTGVKWELAYKENCSKKYVVCNADEGDPGAFMDRAILEGDPHSIIESMIIAGYTIGADEGYIYVRAEYPLAVKRLEIAIKQAKEQNYLGENILNSTFSFDLKIRLGAGAFVCGEETALIASVEGKRGEPTLRPPYPTNQGLYGKPTLLNNVETYANISRIILYGSDWFNKFGTEKSKGTKVFALGGNINNTGLIEVPIGTKLKEIVYEIGGGIPEGNTFKAAQTGGPSGGCIPKELIDIKMDYETLKEIGSMMGSGGLIIMDNHTCMVDIAKFFLSFTVDESCGKCIPCRIGTTRVLEILEKITNGNGEIKDLKTLEELSMHIKTTSLCGLGQTATNPVISTLKYFKNEYIEHIENKKCSAGVCENFIKYQINKDKCKKCGLCARICPVQAISGPPYVIDENKCIKCGKCIENCKLNAIEKK